MRAQVTPLCYWKSEHNKELCEDAYGENIAKGLFAVADGAGTTLFSATWAALLVKHSLRVPLMSDDPFEVEWWVRQAQEQFKQELPGLEQMPWNVLQKAQNQGSHSTFASLCISACEATHSVAELLAIGDSCILVSKASSEQLLSFPLEHEADFAQAPVCLPSKIGLFNRYFHRCHVKSIDLVPGDVVVLATDAVARWIISAGNGRYSEALSALRVVSEQTTDSWADFIQHCRARREMVDDDSTALVITLLPDTASYATALGMTTRHDQMVRAKRKEDFEQAVREQRKERQVLFYGDGKDLNLEGVQMPREQIQQARDVADALSEALAILRRELNSPDVTTIMGSVWQKYAPLLYNEPCAENLRHTLTRLGVPLEVSVPTIGSSEAVPMLDTTVIGISPDFLKHSMLPEATEREET